MDLSHAGLLIAVLFGAGEIIKTLVPNLGKRGFVLALLVVSQAAVQLVAHSVWGHSQVVGPTALDKMNVPSLALVGFMVALAAVTGNRVLDAVRNVGDNQG